MIEHDPDKFASFVENLSWNESLTILFVGLLVMISARFVCKVQVCCKQPIHMDDEMRMATGFYGSLFKFWGFTLQMEAISLS
jgi:hypothetical protein